jgi:NAD(P)-dependent dehydrogenase (short-subunit alcohol dehydrogenase family)
MKDSPKKPLRPAQSQSRQPGLEKEMNPRPKYEDTYPGSGKLVGKVAIITGGDSGIGRAVSVSFIKEGAKVVIVYLNEHADATETQKIIEDKGGECMLLAGNTADEFFCEQVTKETIKTFGKINILVNNAAEQHPQDSIENITSTQLVRTFSTNIFSYFYMTKFSLPHMTSNDRIINTSSVTAYRGSPKLLDYSATKGAIISFTRSLALSLAPRKILVNAVAPGPVWTPLIPSTFPPETVATFGSDVPLARAGEPEEIAPSYVFLASDDSSYMTGQVIHPNGGEIING